MSLDYLSPSSLEGVPLTLAPLKYAVRDPESGHSGPEMYADLTLAEAAQNLLNDACRTSLNIDDNCVRVEISTGTRIVRFERHPLYFPLTPFPDHVDLRETLESTVNSIVSTLWEDLVSEFLSNLATPESWPMDYYQQNLIILARIRDKPHAGRFAEISPEYFQRCKAFDWKSCTATTPKGQKLEGILACRLDRMDANPLPARRGGPRRRAAAEAYIALYPAGRPKTITDQQLFHEIAEEMKRRGHKYIPSDETFRRAIIEA